MVKFYIDVNGWVGWLLLALILVLIGMLIANQFRPVELYIDKSILEEVINGEIQIEKDEPKQTGGRNNNTTAPETIKAGQDKDQNEITGEQNGR